jgi:peptidoglycan/xylan/chitin deacetylase (PgdA/CDA1 family)
MHKVIKRLCNKIIILAYHRVFSPKTDPQLLCVWQKNFEEHLKVIRKNYNPISLSDLYDCRTRKRIPDKSVIITFDDGYKDNLMHACPLLEHYQIPATVFVTTGFIGSKRELWWDDLERLILVSDEMPKELAVTIGSKRYSWKIPPQSASILMHRAWNVSEKIIPSERFTVYKDLHALLRPLNTFEQDEILYDISKQVGVLREGRDDYLICDSQEIIKLARSAYVAVGSHTVTHPVLSGVSRDVLFNELIMSKRMLEDFIQKPVTCFSYPFGSLCDIGHSWKVVKNVGYCCAVANYHDVVTRWSNRFLLPRCLVRNWDRVEFEKKLQEWFGE